MVFQEQYHAMPMAANATYDSPDSGRGIGGFICVTAGTLTMTRKPNGVDIISAFPMTAGAVYGLPILAANGYTIKLAGGASGTLLTQ